MTLTWRKASASSVNGNCVEVAQVPGLVRVRDSRDPDGAVLTVSSRAWHAFLADVRDGQR